MCEVETDWCEISSAPDWFVDKLKERREIPDVFLGIRHAKRIADKIDTKWNKYLNSPIKYM